MGGLTNAMEPCCAAAPVTPAAAGGMAIGGAVTGATNNRLLQSGASGLLENQPTWYFDNLAFGAGMTTRQTLRTALGASGFIASVEGGLLFGRADYAVGLFVGGYNGAGPVIPTGAALRFSSTSTDYRQSDISIHRASATELAVTNSAGSATLDLSVRALKLSMFTVATLPSPSLGLRSQVSDALTPAFAAAVVGGGAVTIGVIYDSTAAIWRCG